MEDCYDCGGSDRLKRIFAFDREFWAQEQGSVCFATPQHAGEHSFCRNCIRTFQKCQYCGDKAAWADVDDDDASWPLDVCANPYKQCWPQYWDAKRNASDAPLDSATHYSLEMRAQTVDDGVRSFVELWPGDGTDPTAVLTSSDDEASSDDSDALHKCHACDAELSAHLAATYHGNNAIYCLECFKQHLLDGTFGDSFA